MDWSASETACSGVNARPFAPGSAEEFVTKLRPQLRDRVAMDVALRHLERVSESLLLCRGSAQHACRSFRGTRARDGQTEPVDGSGRVEGENRRSPS